jgi:hypothetical protein
MWRGKRITMTGRTADSGPARGRHRAAGGLPRRPAAGADQARAQLEYLGTHRGPGSPGWATGPAVLRRVRDALASGGQP